MNVDDNHTEAARRFAVEFGWHGRWIGGGATDGRGDVYVCDDERFGNGVFVIKEQKK